MGWKIFSHLRFRKWLLRGAEVVADPDVLTVWEAEKARAGVENPEFHLVTSDRTDTPLTIGLFAKHVRVVLPKRHYTSQELELIFRHELVHIGREDAWNKFFLAFCTAMCWFNPLMWLAMRKSSEDMELSCDETVLRGLDEGERRGYADLILRTAGDGRGFTTCLSASASALRYRLKSIMKPGKKLPGAFLVGVVFFLLFLTCGQVGLAYGAETGETHIYQDRQDFSLRLVDWADQGAGVSAVCRNEEGLRDDLASLTLLKLAGGYSFEGKEGRLFLLYDAPDAALCVVLWGDYVWVAPYRDGGLLDYDCYYVSGGLDWERLSQFFAMNSEEARP